MASEIELKQGGLPVSEEFLSKGEPFFERLASEPGLRFQIRDALNTFNIEPSQDLGLGYTHRPHANIPKLFACLGIDIDSYNSTQLQNITRAFMEGCFELRDDFGHYRNNKATSDPILGTLKQLPPELQHLAAFKVIGRTDAAYLLATIEGRQQLEGYFHGRLGLTPADTDNLLSAASIIEAPIIITDSLSYPPSEDSWGYSTEVTKLDPGILIGPNGPDYGIHLGSDLMAGVSGALGSIFRGIHNDPKYLAGEEFSSPESFPEWAQALEDFWPSVNRVIEGALKLTDKPEAEYPLWGSYLFMSKVYRQAFAQRVVEGFDGGLDQLTAWREPVPDDEYQYRLNGADVWFHALQIAGSMDIRGVDLAREALAMKLIESLERQVIFGSKGERKGQVSATAKLVRQITTASPDLADRVIEFGPTIGPFLKREAERSADPWGYKFET